MDYFKILPGELTLDILTRVPTESVLDCRLVCTNWKSIVCHPLFSKMHFHHLSNHDSDSGKLGFIALTFNERKNENFQYFEYNENHESIERIRRVNFNPPFQNPKFEFVGSCSGLVCLNFTPATYRPVCIYNPITREYVFLPLIKTECDDNIEDVYRSSGFGYVSSTNEYKVVVLILRTNFYYVYIYTLGSSNGWRKLANLNVGSDEGWIESTFANGVLYWMGFNSEFMVTFDLAEEKFCKHFSAPPLPLYGWIRNRIGVMDGFLFYAIGLFDEGGRACFDVWLLKKKNDNNDILEQGEHQSWVWSKEFRIDGSKLFAVTKTDNVLTYSNNYLNIYDPKASTLKRLVDFKEVIFHIFPHKNTLVSLKELGEEVAKIMEADDQLYGSYRRMRFLQAYL